MTINLKIVIGVTNFKAATRPVIHQPTPNAYGASLGTGELGCWAVAHAGHLRTTGPDQLRIPEAVRKRWNLQDGDQVAYLDVGDAIVILPEGIELPLRSPLESTSINEGQSSDQTYGSDRRRWPPEDSESFRLHVRGETWEVPWGPHDKVGTPAYWVHQTIAGGYADEDEYGIMDPLTAVVWGLLHGGGIKAESGNAFLEPVMTLLGQQPTATAEAIEAALRTPIDGVGRYRFPSRRADYIAAAVDRLRHDPPPRDPEQLRRYLSGLRGVGPKTAALIVSGATGGDAPVHVNDIWLRRALTPAGVFRSEWRFEDAFLQYARHGNVTPGALDWCIWELAREHAQPQQPGPAPDAA